LLQASIAVKVLVIERPTSGTLNCPLTCDKVGVPHASVTVAVPSEPVGFAGLHPNATVV
jgi:hypothetical protein